MQRHFSLVLIACVCITAVLFTNLHSAVTQNVMPVENGTIKVADFEDDENWSTGPCPITEHETTQAVEAAKCQKWAPVDGNDVCLAGLTVALDLSLEGQFTNDDYSYLYLYIVNHSYLSPDGYVEIRYFTSDNNYYKYRWTKADLQEGAQFLKAKKSAFAEVGAPDWSNITYIYMQGDLNLQDQPVELYFDDWRIVKADPDDVTIYLPIILR